MHSDVRYMDGDNAYNSMVNTDMDKNMTGNREMCRHIEDKVGVIGEGMVIQRVVQREIDNSREEHDGRETDTHIHIGNASTENTS